MKYSLLLQVFGASIQAAGVTQQVKVSFQRSELSRQHVKNRALEGIFPRSLVATTELFDVESPG